MRYEFSYPLTLQKSLRGFEGHFRFTDSEEREQLFTSLSGFVRFIGKQNINGRLFIETSLEVTNQHAKLVLEDKTVDIPSDALQLEGGEYWRCCFSHKLHQWRVLSEANTEIMYYTEEYEGVGRIDWYDRSPHVYHVGQIYQLSNSNILLVPDLKLQLTRPQRVTEAIARSKIHEARTKELAEAVIA